MAFKLDDGEGYPINQSGALAQSLGGGTQPNTARLFNSRGANTYESMLVAGSGTTFTTTVSPDGQTLTRTQTGQSINNVAVFDRVR